MTNASEVIRKALLKALEQYLRPRVVTGIAMEAPSLQPHRNRLFGGAKRPKINAWGRHKWSYTGAQNTNRDQKGIQRSVEMPRYKPIYGVVEDSTKGQTPPVQGQIRPIPEHTGAYRGITEHNPAEPSITEHGEGWGGVGRGGHGCFGATK